MLMNFGKEYVSITLKLVMYASIYKPTKEIKVGLFIPKNHAICLNVKKKLFCCYLIIYICYCQALLII